jgi:predicted outer membrane repeat protein
VVAGTLNNCMLSGNSATVGGGAIGATLNNCTLVGNSVSYIAQSHVFHVTNRPEGKGGGPINRLGLIPRCGSRCTSPPDAPLAWPPARSAERRCCPPTTRPEHIPCPPHPGVSSKSNLRFVAFLD